MPKPLAKPGPLLSIAGASLLFATPLAAQTLPPVPPTTIPVPAAARSATPQQPAGPNRARVDYMGQLLTITADNSSLNQILREISRVTGMIITGGVTDERVFGTIGPADPSTVLTTLLNGTGSNMLLSLDAQKIPRELVLSPRQGGPTPPNPNASRGDDDRHNDFVPQQQNQRMFNRDNPPQIQQQQQQQPPPQPPAAPAASTSPADTTQQSPNGVKTPQQIYDELVKMNQKPTPPPQ